MQNKKKVKPLCLPGRPSRFEDVIFAKDVPLDNGKTMDLKMDIYQDLNQKEPGPCIIYYFGGAWLWGEYKQVTQKAVYCRDLIKLVEQGYTIVSPAYRLASEAVFPAAIHDCKAAVRFLKAHADEYHIDPERIGVLGNSAGAHLAAMVACSSDCEEMEGTVGGNTQYSSKVKAAAVFYTPADLVESAKNVAKKNQDLKGTEIDDKNIKEAAAVECQILGYSGEGKNIGTLSKLIQSGDTSHPDWHYVELAKKCSPITYVSENCPPIILLHGGEDSVVPISQSENFYKAFVDKGADATYLSYSKAGHGPSINKEADQFAYQFLMKHI